MLVSLLLYCGGMIGALLSAMLAFAGVEPGGPERELLKIAQSKRGAMMPARRRVMISRRDDFAALARAALDSSPSVGCSDCCGRLRHWSSSLGGTYQACVPCR
jgi:hypothetical protein